MAQGEYAGDLPGSPSPDPNRRRCRQCGDVGEGLLAVGRRKFKTVLWGWYHEDHVPSDAVREDAGRFVYRGKGER